MQCTTEDKSNDNSSENVVSDTTEAKAESVNVAAVAENDENENTDEAAAAEEALRNELITSAYNIANILAESSELDEDIMSWLIKESLALTRKLCELQDMEGLPE